MGAHSGGPLSGLTVVDFSTFLAGPFCTQLLGDLGADVIKVEPPGGDSSRTIPPHFVAGESLYYLSVNRNKRSVVVDVKSVPGREVALSLIDRADVVVENFGPGVAARLGLNAEAVCARRPELVWASITGFGRVGDRTDLPAYDMIVQALSGVMMTTGEPGGQPVRLGIPAGDLVAGLYSGVGILAELAARPVESTGPVGPRVVDVSMFDGLVSMLSYLGVYSLYTGVPPGPQGSAHASIPTYRSFVAGDGARLVLTANTERMWRELCAVLEREELVEDPRFDSAGGRLANAASLWPVLEAAFLERPAEEWVKRCVARDVPAALVTDVPEALEAARRDSRSMILELHSAAGDRTDVIGNPVKVLGRPEPEAAYPPRLGEHTREVLAGVLNLTDQQIDQLHAEGAVS